jgi:hypothetical protein
LLSLSPHQADFGKPGRDRHSRRIMRIFPGRKYDSGMLWCVWRWTDVDPEGDGVTYLTRLHLFRLPWCSCMLHWIPRPDPQPDLHDHPVAFLSIVLCGCYDEEIPDRNAGLRTVRVRWWNFKRATDRHRIVSVGGRVVTLVFAGRATREWGFHAADGWLPWRDYVARRRESE